MSSDWWHVMGRWGRWGCCLGMLLLGMFGSGCSLLPGFHTLPYSQQMAPLPPGSICQVAVLPFVDESEYPLAGAIAGKVFASQLQAEGDYLVVQEGDVLKVYQQLHILPAWAPTEEQMQIIANRLHAQLLITGIVLEMREDRGEHGTVNPRIIEEIQIRDGRTGQVIWTTFHRRQGTDYTKTMHFGTIHTVTGLSKQMAVEIINLWFKKGLAKCNESS